MKLRLVVRTVARWEDVRDLEWMQVSRLSTFAGVILVNVYGLFGAES